MENAALADSSTDGLTDLAQSLLEEGETLPAFHEAEPLSPAPANTPNAPATRTEASVVIGGETLSLADAKDLIEKGRNSTQKWQEASKLKKDAEAISAENEEAIRQFAYWQSVPAEIKNSVITYLDAMAEGTTATLTPAGEIPLDEMGPAERMIFAHVQSLRSELNQVVGIVNRVKEIVAPIHDQAQENRMVEGLKAEGIITSVEKIREMKANGIADPMAALRYLKVNGALAGAPAAPKAVAVPEAPSSTEEKVFDDDDPDMKPDQMMALLQAGWTPKSSLKK